MVLDNMWSRVLFNGFSIESRTKDCCAYSHHCATTFLCYHIVATHTVGTYGEVVIAGKVFCLYLVEEIGCGDKFPAYLVLIIHIACHHHNTTDADVWHCLPFTFSKHLPTFIECHTAFGFFVCDMEFEKYVNDTLYLGCLFLYFTEKTDRVNSFNHRNVWNDVFHLVGL